MPFDHGLRLNNRQRIANAREKPIKANKNQAVDGAEGLFLRSGAPQNVYLLPQRPYFCLKRRPRPDQIDDRPTNEPDKIPHLATASPDSRSTASQIRFATGTGPLRLHFIEYGLHDADWRLKVDLDHAIKLIVCNGARVRVGRDAGVVDETVDATPERLACRDNFGGRAVGRNVAHDGRDMLADLLELGPRFG